MNRINSVTKPLTWFMTLLLVALAAGCGGAGQSPILGGGGAGVILGAPPGAIIPGGVCIAATGPTIPTVASTNPINGNQSVSVGTGVKQIMATFSLAMNPATINSATAGALSTFTLKNMATGAGTIVTGTVAMNGTNMVATFTTSSPLVANTSYTAVITTAATSSVATGSIPIGCNYAWNFKTAAVAVPLAINLGKATTFGIASRAGMTTTGVTVVNGDIALYPTATCQDATGGPGGSLQSCLVQPVYATTTGMTVNGTIYWAADPFDSGVTAQAVTTDLTTAWNEGMAKVNTQPAIAAGEIGGKTFIPGVYENANLTLAAGGVAILDAQNDPNAIFIFKTTLGGDFIDSGTLLLPTRINLINQAQARNVWFVIGRDITIGSGTIWNGNILANRTVTVLDGSTVNGRVLAGAGGAGALTLTGAAAPSVTTITVP